MTSYPLERKERKAQVGPGMCLCPSPTLCIPSLASGVFVRFARAGVLGDNMASVPPLTSAWPRRHPRGYPQSG